MKDEPERWPSMWDRLIDVDWHAASARTAAWLRTRMEAIGRRLLSRERVLAAAARLKSRSRSIRPSLPGRTLEAPSPKPRRAVPIRAIGSTLALTVILLAGYVAYCLYAIPVDGGVVADGSTGAMLIQAADGRELATRGTPRGDKLGIDDMPGTLKNAIVAIEDRRFYSHGALDFHGIVRAVLRDTFRGRSKEGASTLTQQLARLMLLSPDRTAKRKVQEALIAFWLEHHLGKKDILERYLNTAYFGAGAYGVDAAAQRYFGKSARDLTLPEAAMIAGLVRAPSHLAPHRNLEAAQKRARLVLHAMVETGALSAQDEAEARAHPATLKVSPESASGSGYAADAAATEVHALVGNSAVDVTASTTIDPELQALAERVVSKHLDGEGARKDVGQAALIAIGADGAILAMVGGADYDANAFNRATQAKRQPGSLFKLFVYLSALRAGAMVDTTVVDEPVRIGDWEPHNYENGYRGRIPLHVAFAHSLNTVAAELAQKVGIPTVIKTAHELGVTSDLANVPSLALGTASVSLSEMTRAFATVASDQDTLEPFLVRRVASHDKVLFNRPQRYSGDGEPDAAKLAMRELLADVVREGTGRAAQLSMPTGGKTGTTQDYRDAWFIGSAPDLTVGVWTGNDDDGPMKGVTGGDVPAKIWHDFVAGAETIIAAHALAAKPKVAAFVAAGVPSAKEPAPTTASAAEAVPPTAVQPASAGQSAVATIVGEAAVATTADLDVDGQAVTLEGVEPLEGRPARALGRYLRRREISCSSASAGTFRCSVDGNDLATTILANGGSPAKIGAPADLLAAQDGAQAQRRGIWRHRR